MEAMILLRYFLGIVFSLRYFHLKDRSGFHELRQLGIRVAKINFSLFTEGFKFVWPDVGNILFL